MSDPNQPAQPDTRAQLREARRTRALLEEQCRAKVLERRLQQFRRTAVQESWYDWPARDPRLAAAADGWHPAGTAAVTTPSDRKAGRQWPLAWSEFDLDRLRQQSRVLCDTNGHAKGLLRNLVNYVVGTGPTVTVAPRADLPDADPKKPGGQADTPAQKLARLCQRHADLFARRMNLRQKAREAYRRSKRDGEWFWRLYPDPETGGVLVRWVEPELVRNPPGGTEADGWWGGVESDPLDVEDRKCYHVVYPGYTPPEGADADTPTGEYIPAAEMIHGAGVDTDATLKRGLPEFVWDTFDAFRRAASLQRSSSEGSAERAAIAIVSQWENATQQQVTDWADSDATYTETNPRTGSLERIRESEGPQWLHLPKGHEFVPPPTATGASTDVQVQQADLRAAVAPFCAPEYFTGDASNASYASTKEASAPFLKAAEAEQAYLADMIRLLVVKHLDALAESGNLDGTTPEGLWATVDVQVELPAIVQRDPMQQSSRLTQLVGAKLKSPQQAIRELGDKPEVAMAEMAAWDSELQKQNGLPNLGDVDGQGDGGPPTAEAEAVPGALTEGLLEGALLEAGFTGVITDSLGRTYHYQDGRRVKAADAAGTEVRPDPANPVARQRSKTERHGAPVGVFDAADKDHMLGDDSYKAAVGNLLAERMEDAGKVLRHRLESLAGGRDGRDWSPEEAVTAAAEAADFAHKQIDTLSSWLNASVKERYGEDYALAGDDEFRAAVQRAKDDVEYAAYAVSGLFEDLADGSHDGEDFDNDLADALDGLEEEMAGAADRVNEAVRIHLSDLDIAVNRRQQDWADGAAQAAGEMAGSYDADDEGARADAASYNDALQSEGNPYRVYWDGESWTYGDVGDVYGEYDYPGQENDQSLMESYRPRRRGRGRLLEAGFTGELTDSAGRHRRYVDGKQVAYATAAEAGAGAAATGAGAGAIPAASARLKDAAAWAGAKAWQQVPDAAKPHVEGAYKLAKAVEHKLSLPRTAGPRMVEELAREWGLDGRKAKMAGRIAWLADEGLAWTANIAAGHGLAHAALHALHVTGAAGEAGSFLGAKPAYFVPAASLAFVAASTAANPLATIRAAGRVIAGLREGHAVPEAVDPAAARGLLAALQGHGDDEWYVALLHAALDEAQDLGAALELAGRAYQSAPAEPLEEGADAVTAGTLARTRDLPARPLPEADEDAEDPQQKAEAIADLLLAVYGDRALELFGEVDDEDGDRADVSEGFTGVVTDSAGREQHYVDGVHVAGAAGPAGSENAAGDPKWDGASPSDLVRNWATSQSGPLGQVTSDALAAGRLPANVAAVYRQTQQALGESGVTSRELYRGVAMPQGRLLEILRAGEMDLSRAGSWSENASAAREFVALNMGGDKLNVLLSCPDMPAKAIIASHDTSDVFGEVADTEGYGQESESLAAPGRLRLAEVRVNREPVEDLEELAEQIRSGEIDEGDRITLEFARPEGLLEAWNEIDHPRGKGGKFIKRNSPEAVANAKGQVAAALKETPSPEQLKKLTEALSIMTVAQIHGLKKEYGLSGSGRGRDELVAKIAARLSKGRSGEGTPVTGDEPSYKEWAAGEREKNRAKGEEQPAEDPRPDEEPEPEAGGKEGTPEIVSDLNRMLEIQADSFEKKHGWKDGFTRQQFLKNWKKSLKGLEPDPAAVAELSPSVAAAFRGYDIPRVPVFIRKQTAEEKPIGENAHWDNGFVVLSDDAAEERKYRSQKKPLGSDRKSTVKESYDDVITGLIVHELGHKYHDDFPGAEQTARGIMADPAERKQVARLISNYAASHPKEMVAEAYAMRKHGDFDQLPAETKDLVFRILGENAPDNYPDLAPQPAAPEPAADAGRGGAEPAGVGEPQPGDAAPEPGFTGTDALGRRWQDGELVAAKDEPGATPPQAPPAAAPAPAAEPPAAEGDVLAAAGDAHSELAQASRRFGGFVKVPELVDKIRERVPGATAEQVKGLLQKWRSEGKLTLQLNVDPDREPRAAEGIRSPRGLEFYVHWDDARKPAAGSGKPGPKAASAPADPAAAAGQALAGLSWSAMNSERSSIEQRNAERAKYAAAIGQLAALPDAQARRLWATTRNTAAFVYPAEEVERARRKAGAGGANNPAQPPAKEKPVPVQAPRDADDAARKKLRALFTGVAATAADVDAVTGTMSDGALLAAARQAGYAGRDRAGAAAHLRQKLAKAAPAAPLDALRAIAAESETHPGGDFADLERRVDAVTAGMRRDDIVQAARDLGVQANLKNKEHARQKVREKVLDRLYAKRSIQFKSDPPAGPAPPAPAADSFVGAPPATPAAAPAPAAASTPAPAAHPPEVHAAVGKLLAQSPGLPSELQSKYGEAAGNVLAKMHPASRKAALGALDGGKATFHPDMAALRKAYGGKAPPGTVGFVQYRPKFLDRVELHLDGAGEGDDNTHEAVYAHEMGHLVDLDYGQRTGERLSDSAGWKAAWKAEIKGAKVGKGIGRYAMTNESEGLAELYRYLHQHGAEAAAARCPKCVNLLRKEGLL